MTTNRNAKVLPNGEDQVQPFQETEINFLHDESNNMEVWKALLEPYPSLKKYGEEISKNSISLEQIICDNHEWSLVNSWLQELPFLPLGPRTHIITLLKRTRQAWDTAEEEGGRPEKITAEWLTSMHVQANPAETSGGNRLVLIPICGYQVSRSYLMGIPIVNILYDFFFDETPTIEAMKETLNLLGVMGALIFTIVITIPLSFDYEAYEALIERWSGSGPYRNCWIDGWGELEYFILTTSYSIAFAFVTVILVIFIYVLLVNSRLKTNQERQIWWQWIRWLYLIIFCTLIASCCNSFMSLRNLIEWNVPNKVVLDSPLNKCSISLLSSSNNIWGKNAMAMTWVCAVLPLLSVFILSMAIRAKSRISAVTKPTNPIPQNLR